MLGASSTGLARAAAAAGDAAAIDAPLPVEVTVGPRFCSTANAVESEVTRRSPRIRFVAPTGVEVRQVTVEGADGSSDGGYLATVVLRTAAAAEVRRQLEAKSCDDLVRAVGFVISVTYDPPAPDVVQKFDEPAVTPAPPRADADQAVPRSSLAVPTQPRSSDEEGNSLDVPDQDRIAASPPRWRAGLGGGAVWGIAPSWMLGGEAFVAMGWGPTRGAGGLVRLLVAGDFSRPQGFPGGVAVFQRWSGQLALGPEWHWSVVDLGLMATGRAGLISARGRSTREPRSYDRVWIDAGGAVLGRAEVLEGWHLEAELSVAKPLTRYAFQFDPVVFHRVSSWLVHAGIAASVAF